MFEVHQILHDQVVFKLGPSVSEPEWSKIEDHPVVTMSHSELLRLIEERKFVFDDPSQDEDDPYFDTDAYLYPALEFGIAAPTTH